MSQPPELPIASLRRLARGLLYDEARADDGVPEAGLAARRRAPPPEGLRAWMSEAVRRLARSSGRDERRRAAREERAARPEALPSAAEASARIEILRRLLDAVDALEDPYRTAVVLRYFDELPPRVIAKRLGIPVNTARTHVRRGLERLRRQLDGERGQGRDELLAALVPLAGGTPWRLTLGGPSTVLAPLGIGGLGMNAWIVTAAGVAVLGGALWFLRGEPTGEQEPERVARAEEGAGSSSTSRASTSGSSSGALVEAPSSAGREPAHDAPLASTNSWTVRGHVFKGRREAYANAELVGRVYAGTATEGAPLLDEHFHADEHGDFAWSIAPPTETVAVRVEPARHGQKTESTWDVFRPGDPAPERWYLNAYPLDGMLVGVVRNVGGDPIPGARVVHERFSGIEEVRTDAEGRYSIPISSSREWLEVTLIAEGFGLTRFQVNDLHPGEQTRDVTLEPERRAHGRVVDSNDAPIAGALVSADFPPELTGTRTDAAGRFELGEIGVPSFGQQLTLWAIAPGFPTQNKSVLDLAEEVELRLTSGVRLSGRVLTPDRAPAAGTQVSVGYGVYPYNATYTDEEGRFELAPTWTGKNELWLWRRGFGQLRHDVEVPEGVDEVEGIELVLPPPHFLGGTVLDETGEPVPWAWIYVDDPDESERHVDGFSTNADADGRFYFEGLPDVPMKLGVMEAGHPREEWPVAALDRDDVVLRLTRGAGIAGRVLDDASGLPVPSFTVKVAQYDQRLQNYTSIPERTFSDPSGEWRTEVEFAAGYQLCIEVTASGYAACLAHVQSSAGPNPEDCVVRLRRGARVRGRVVDRLTQQPAAGARVERRSPADRMGFALTPNVTRTNESGEFELVDVPLGRMTLRVEASGSGAVDGPFEVGEGEVHERSIEVGSGGRISGRLLDAAGTGLEGATVELLADVVVGNNGFWTATSAADGSFAFAELPAGIFQLYWKRELDGKHASDLREAVTLAGGEERRIDLQPRGGVTLRGTVAVAEGALPEVVPVYLGPQRGNQDYPGDGMRGAFAVNGTFEVPALEAGKWAVTAYARSASGEWISATATLEIPTEGVVEVQLVLQPHR